MSSISRPATTLTPVNRHRLIINHFGSFLPGSRRRKIHFYFLKLFSYVGRNPQSSSHLELVPQHAADITVFQLIQFPGIFCETHKGYFPGNPGELSFAHFRCLLLQSAHSSIFRLSRMNRILNESVHCTPKLLKTAPFCAGVPLSTSSMAVGSSPLKPKTHRNSQKRPWSEPTHKSISISPRQRREQRQGTLLELKVSYHMELETGPRFGQRALPTSHPSLHVEGRSSHSMV